MKLLDDTSSESYEFMKSAKRTDWFKKFMAQKDRKDPDGLADKKQEVLKKAAEFMRKLASAAGEDFHDNKEQGFKPPPSDWPKRMDAPAEAEPAKKPSPHRNISSLRHQPHGRGGYKTTWDYCQKHPGDPLCKRFSKAANLLAIAALWKHGCVGQKKIKPCGCTRSSK